MAMNVIELTEAPVVKKVPEGATCFCLNPDGSVNRFALDNLNQTEEVIFHVNFPSTVGECASDEVSSEPTVTCDKTPSEIKALIESGEKVDYWCYLSDDSDDNCNERVRFVSANIDSSVDDSKTRVMMNPFLVVGFMACYVQHLFTINVFDNNDITCAVIGE